MDFAPAESQEAVARAPAALATLGGGPVPGTVSGVKLGVPYAAAARWILVPATIAAGGTGVVIIDPADAGVSLTPTHASGSGPEYTLRLDGAPVRGLLGGAADGRAVPTSTSWPSPGRARSRTAPWPPRSR